MRARSWNKMSLIQTLM